MSRYSRRDVCQGKGCHEQAEKATGQDTEGDDAYDAAIAIDSGMLKWWQSNALSNQKESDVEVLETFRGGESDDGVNGKQQTHLKKVCRGMRVGHRC